MRKNIIFVVLAALTVILTGCPGNEDGVQFKKEAFKGYVQKGPFTNGSSVTIIGLNSNLNQTGKTYYTTIANNLGNFEQNNIELPSSYVELKAEGYYFNEIIGETSSGTITLYAISDIRDVTSANINVLTHLEKSRVEHLVKQQGIDFAPAKRQALQEVLGIFGFTFQEENSEALNLTSSSELLAISCILQGYLSTGDMMALMADIITDIETDGRLDNISLGTKLINNAYSVSLSLTEIRNKLVSKYTELGISVNIPDFESKIISFVNSGMYPQTLSISYPKMGESGPNILSDEVTTMTTMRGPTFDYSLKAEVPKGFSLKIVAKGEYYADLGYPSQSNSNWNVIVYDDPNNPLTTIREFTVTESGKPSDLKIQAYDPFDEYGQTQITEQSCIVLEFYENGATIPAKTKRIQVISSY